METCVDGNLAKKLKPTLNIKKYLDRAQTLLTMEGRHIQPNTLESKYDLRNESNLARFAQVIEMAEADPKSIFTDLLEKEFGPEATRKRHIKELLEKTIKILKEGEVNIPGAHWLVAIFGLRNPENVKRLKRILEEVEKNPSVRLGKRLMEAFRPHIVPTTRKEVRLRVIEKNLGDHHKIGHDKKTAQTRPK